jgi:hypothetical protein
MTAYQDEFGIQHANPTPKESHASTPPRETGTNVYSDTHLMFRYPQSWNVSRDLPTADEYSVTLTDGSRIYGNISFDLKNHAPVQTPNELEAVLENVVTELSFDSFNDLSNSYGTHVLIDFDNYFIIAAFISQSKTDLAAFHAVMSTMTLR